MRILVLLLAFVLSSSQASAAWIRDIAVPDPWTGGAYSDVIVDMGATDAEATIVAGAPPVHFACSEISPSFPGYVEGAIVAGRVVAERCAALLAQSASATSASGS